MQSIITRITAALFFVSFASCINTSSSIDLTPKVSKDPVLSRGYIPGNVYELKVDLLLLNTGIPSLVTPGGARPFIHDYLNNPKRYPRIAGILRAGTRLKITKISYYERPGGPIKVFVNALVLAEDSEIKIISMSGASNYIHGTVYGPLPYHNPNLLLLVN